MTTEEMIKWIDNASVYSLLYKWRFSKSGDPFFQGEVGEHYEKVIGKAQSDHPDEWVSASKEMGWER